MIDVPSSRTTATDTGVRLFTCVTVATALQTAGSIKGLEADIAFELVRLSRGLDSYGVTV